jgi:hypothetical protein
MVTQINSATAVPATANHIVGWYKKQVTTHTVANFKLEITTEYVYGNFATFYYTASVL